LSTDISLKSINKLAIPALIAGIAEPLLSITDTAIIGNIDENATESLAAVGIVGAFISMLIWVFGQIRSAISSIISQYLGANKLDEVKTLPAQAIAIIVLGSLLILAISYPFAKQIFQFYNASGQVLPAMHIEGAAYVELSKKLFKYGILTGTLIAIVGFIFYNHIGQIFTKEATVLAKFNHVFWIVLLTQPISAITFIFDGMFKGMGKMKYLRNLLILSTGLVFIPTLLVFDYYDLKLVAIWIAFTLWILARGLPLVLKFRSEFLPLTNK